ncbi:hypothetical protein OsI_21900 [Oryza sativa Indica Group]|uniref:Uncharacterized protein n=1 Tax=Oryza sativa subsp. indica TaxID=39946 RepID=B8B3H0_ORYSI|nr:hypothetical protein OsI_21900 [Oryza sativa Indica Group]
MARVEGVKIDLFNIRPLHDGPSQRHPYADADADADADAALVAGGGGIDRDPSPSAPTSSIPSSMASKANSWLPAAGAPRCPWPASTLPVGADFFNSFHDGVDASLLPWSKHAGSPLIQDSKSKPHSLAGIKKSQAFLLLRDNVRGLASFTVDAESRGRC